jgi:hypothetical protein
MLTAPIFRAVNPRKSKAQGTQRIPTIRSVIRTLLSQIVNRVIISLITKAVPGVLPSPRKRPRLRRPAPSRNRTQPLPDVPAAQPQEPRRKPALRSSARPGRAAEPPLEAPNHHSVVASGPPRSAIAAGWCCPGAGACVTVSSAGHADLQFPVSNTLLCPCERRPTSGANGVPSIRTIRRKDVSHDPNSSHSQLV